VLKYKHNMKRKAFGVIAMFLVMFQLFSPWGIQINKNGVVLEKNIVSARTIADTDMIPFFHDAKDGEVTLTILTSPTTKVTGLNVQARNNDKSLQLSIFNGDISSLPTSDIKNLGIVSLRNSQTVANLYLRTDYILKNTAFKEDMVADISGFDNIDDGNLYVSIDKNGVKNVTSHNTGNNSPESEDYDKILSGKSAYIPFVSTQNQIGDDFDASWGLLAGDKVIIPVGGGSAAELSCEDGSANLKGDKEYELTPTNTTASPVEKKIKFAQDNKEYKYYEYLCTTRASKNTQKPKIENSISKYVLNYDSSFTENVSLAFDLPINGKYHSWKYLNDQNDKSATKKISCVADYCMDNLSVSTGELTKKDKDINVDVTVSLFLSKKNTKDFPPFFDKGDVIGEADPKDDPGQWTSFLGEDNGIETRDAKDGGNGFYLVWANHTEPTIEKDNVINLSEYFFGKKLGVSPIIAGKNGMSFKMPVGPLTYGATYYFRIYGADKGEGWFDVAEGGYSIESTKKVDQTLEQITQITRDAEVVEEGQALNDANLAWLPKCGLGFWPASDGSMVGCLIQIFYALFFETTSALLGVAGTVMDWVVVYAISPVAYKAQYIVDSWKFVRDVCNLFFIFMMIYLAFKLILSIGHHTKQLIVNTLIIAAVINFSYPLTTVIIDVSNIAARQLYYNSFKQKDENTGKPIGLSATAAKGYNPQRMVIDGIKNSGFDVENNRGSVFMIILMGVIFNIIAMIIFLKIALLFIYRILGLIFAIILSPFAVFSFSMDKEQRSKLKMVGFDTWLSGLIQDAFKAPVFLFLILILVLFVANNPFKASFGEGVNGLEWWVSIIIPFMLVIGFLNLIHSVTKSMSSSLAEMAGGLVMKGIGAVAGVAAGGLALAGAGLGGRLGTRLVNSETGQRIMDRAAKSKGLGGFIARQQAKAMRGMQTGSFDLRQNGVANAVSKATGMNFNLGASAIGLGTAKTAGGYMAATERQDKKRDEFIKMLEWNKQNMDKIKQDKINKEDEKAKKEVELKDQKAAASENEKLVRDAEKDKKEVEERIANFEKLEDLIAKMNDAKSAIPPMGTNEIEVQIGRIEAKLGSVPGELVDTTGTIVNKKAAFDTRKTMATGTRDAMKADLATKQANLDISNNQLKTTEKEIRELDKSIAELTKFMKNLKEDRKNGTYWRIRNKSGHIFQKDTYNEKYDSHGHSKALTTEQIDQRDRLRAIIGNDADNIITRVDEHSHETNKKYIAGITALNSSIGLLAGAFTGGLGAIAVGALTGGVVGMARSYRPDNEHYGIPHEEGSWHSHAHDNYKPPSGSGGGGGHSSGDGGHH